MNVSRRPAVWRLAALAVVMLLLAPGAFAQSTQRLRVKIGPANVYERPRTTSEVFMVAPEGTVLDVLGREETWYWVLLPPDGNGLRRSGYIAMYLVDLIGPKGPDAVSRTAQGALALKPPTARPATRGDREGWRYFAAIGAGGQSSSRPFADSFTYPQYELDQDAQLSAHYGVPGGSALDATLGLRLSSHFVLAVAFWHSTSVPTANISAVIPSWYSYTAPGRPASTTHAVGRTENDGHLQLTWYRPLSQRAELSIFGGPSLFYVRQELVSWPLTLNEVYPFETVGIEAKNTISKWKATFGGNAGVDLTVTVWRYFGVGMTARYAYGSMSMASAGGGTVKVQVGGVQASGGLRVRF